MSKTRLAVVIPTSLKDKPYATMIEDHYTAYYPIIGCRCFDVVELDEANGKSVDCYVDDEGMINKSPINEYWLRAYKNGITNNPLFGVCVITMTDLETGDSTETDLNLVKEVLKRYGFTEKELSF